MKILKKILVATVAFVLTIFIVVMLYGYYLTITKCVEPFHTTFLQKDIRFPMSVVDAARKYNLSYDSVGVRGVSFSDTDTIMVVDAKKRSTENYCVLFYLRDMSKDSIQCFKDQLEKKYNGKFMKTEIDPSFQYMKINDCVYLLIHKYYGATTTGSRLLKHLPTRNITCRVGFYYGLSEDELINTSADGHYGIIGRGYEPTWLQTYMR